MSDDVGWGDISCYQPSNKFKTPAIDKLAREGTRFTNAHAPHSVCTPTRAALLSGQSPVAAHITDWTLHVDRNFARPMPPLTDPDWCKAGLAPSPDLLPELLRDAGYRVIARYRMGLFGGAETCSLPRPGEAEFQFEVDY